MRTKHVGYVCLKVALSVTFFIHGNLDSVHELTNVQEVYYYGEGVPL